MKKILQNIFSVRNEFNQQCQTHKVISLLGIKIKFKYFNKNLLSRIENLEVETKLLRTIIINSIDITKIPPSRGNLRTVQLIKTKILEIIDFILIQKNIQYWLDYGTLIGAIRHHGFIPWDDDIDISIIWDDYIKIPKIFKFLKSLSEKFFIIYGWKGSEIIRIGYEDFCVDFFPMEYLNKKCIKQEEKYSFEKKWNHINKQMIEIISFEKFQNHEKHHLDDDVLKIISKLKNEVFGNYESNSSSGQVILAAATISTHNVPHVVLEDDNIFPLKKCKFEHLSLPIPVNPIEHLYETRMYGAKGSVMNFPSFKDHGFEHTQGIYNADADYYQNILNELTEITDKIKEEYTQCSV